MDMNFLQQILGPQPAYAQPMPAALTADPQQYATLSPQAIQQQQVPQPAPIDVMQDAPAAPAPDQAPVDLDPNAMPQPVNPVPDLSGYQAPDIQPAKTRQRQSAIDVIGRLADVFAKVGGAQALYQPTLDARADRVNALEDRQRQISMDQTKIATAGLDLTDKQNALVGRAVHGLKALVTAGGDAATAWPLLAKQMGLPPEATARVASILNDPKQLDALDQAVNDDPTKTDKYGVAPIFMKDADGNIHAFQPSSTGADPREIVAPGMSALEPTTTINTGGAQVVTGKYSGGQKAVFSNTLDPKTVANNQTQRDIAAGRNQTAVTIAGMPARAGAGKAAGDNKSSDPSAGLALMDSIQKGFDNLHGMQALPGEGSTGNNIFGAIGRSTIGQKLGATLGTPAAQERELLAKNLANLQSDLIKTLPASAVRTKFEQEIQKRRLPDPTTMSYDTANRAINEIRQTYLNVLKQPQQAKPAAGSTPVKRPVLSTNGKQGSGWGTVVVH